MKKKQQSSKEKPEKRKQASPHRKDETGIRSSQILIILLLIVIAGILSFLISLFFQPDRIQLWQEQLIPADRENTSLPEVKRLSPQEEPTLQVTELPVQDEEVKPEQPKEEPAQPEQQTRNARLFFIKVNAEGQITLKSIIRPVQYNMSPLTETIHSLLNGPSSDEINKGSLTLIPDGTRLLSARVEGSTAFLNFNEAFRFNSLGREGYTAQLKQIVYTTTEFSNIHYVQIMIEGSIKEYLGGEGIFVGEPLSRETFQAIP